MPLFLQEELIIHTSLQDLQEQEECIDQKKNFVATPSSIKTTTNTKESS
jgi:hypothetical protein